MTLWCLGTVGHFLLTARWLKRAGGAISRDELWFQTMVVGAGTLSIALHVVASTTGLTLTRVLLVLLAGHALAAWYGGRASLQARVLGLETQAELRSGDTQVETDLVTRTLELAAIVAITAVVIQWTLLALPTAEVSGSDAAHYHVPNAVNMALGASPFDLPPTPHLYPMDSSTLAAWFILPVQTTLLADLVMVLPFLLLVSAAGWLFRQLTSLSGLAWSTWAMLALFGTPLFRYASLMSADLLFAAASMAFAAALLSPLIRRQLKPADLWLIALSLGLLLGAKITGIAVAGLLGIPAVLALAILKFRGKWTASAPAWVWAGAALAVIGAGGIWLVRNWWVWGSPVAPNGLTLFGHTLFPGANFEATTYNSILGDIDANATYDLWDRARHYSGLWLGRWYLIGLGVVMLIPIDAVAGWWRGAPRPLLAIRLWASIVAFGTAAVMVQFLIGAPWTSLEWTKGFSLRYALPWLALVPIVAWAGVFPSTLPWYRRPVLAVLGGIAIGVAGLTILGQLEQPLFPPVPTLPTLIAAVLTWGVITAAVSGSKPGWMAAAATVLVVSVVFGGWIGDADARAREARATAMIQGPRTEGERIYDAALQREAREGVACAATGRRFFITTRFDEPLALQSERHTNLVLFAGRDVEVTALVRPVMGPCDYLITDRAVLGTDKGANLHAALNTSGTLVEVSTLNGLVLLAHR